LTESGTLELAATTLRTGSKKRRNNVLTACQVCWSGYRTSHAGGRRKSSTFLFLFFFVSICHAFTGGTFISGRLTASARNSFDVRWWVLRSFHFSVMTETIFPAYSDWKDDAITAQQVIGR